MIRIFLGMAALPLMGMASPAAMVTSVGAGAAKSCYKSAVASNSSAAAMTNCDTAIGQGALLHRDRVATFINRGILYMVRDDYPRAEADFQRAVAMDPGHADAWLNYGIAHYQQGKMGSATTMFERALTLRTRDPALAYFGRALVKEDTGDVRGAYADLRRAAALNPSWEAPALELRRFRVVRKGG